MNPRWDRSGVERKLDPSRTTVVMLWADGVEVLCGTFPAFLAQLVPGTASKREYGTPG